MINTNSTRKIQVSASSSARKLPDTLLKWVDDDGDGNDCLMAGAKSSAVAGHQRSFNSAGSAHSLINKRSGNNIAATHTVRFCAPNPTARSDLALSRTDNEPNLSSVPSFSPSSSISTLPDSEDDDLMDGLELQTHSRIGDFMRGKLQQFAENDTDEVENGLFDTLKAIPYQLSANDEEFERTLICSPETIRETVSLKGRKQRNTIHSMKNLAIEDGSDNNIPYSRNASSHAHIDSHIFDVNRYLSKQDLRTSKSVSNLKPSSRQETTLTGDISYTIQPVNHRLLPATICNKYTGEQSACLTSPSYRTTREDSLTDKVGSASSIIQSPRSTLLKKYQEKLQHFSTRSPRSKLRSAKRGPILISHKSSESSFKNNINGMIYDQKNCCWRGNEEFGKAFVQALRSPPRPKLISKKHFDDPLVDGSSNMRFDSINLRWVNVETNAKDEDDPFKDFEDLQDEYLILDAKTGKRVKKAQDIYLNSSGHFVVGDEFNVSSSWIESERRNERLWRMAVDGWTFDASISRNRGKYWEIRSLLLDQVI